MCVITEIQIKTKKTSLCYKTQKRLTFQLTIKSFDKLSIPYLMRNFDFQRANLFYANLKLFLFFIFKLGHFTPTAFFSNASNIEA